MGIIWIVSIIATVVLAFNKKLNIFLYSLLSICLGPLAFIIALCERPGKTSSKTSAPLEAPGSIENELNSIKNSLNYLQQRVNKFECLIREKIPSEMMSPPEQIVEEKGQIKAKEIKGFEFVFG